MKVNNPIKKLPLEKSRWGSDNEYDVYIKEGKLKVHNFRVYIYSTRAILSCSHHTKWFKKKVENYNIINNMLIKMGILSKVIPYRKYHAVSIPLSQIEIIKK